MRVWTRAEYRPDRLNITVTQRQRRAANRSHFSMMLQSAGEERCAWEEKDEVDVENERANEGERFGVESKNGKNGTSGAKSDI